MKRRLVQGVYALVVAGHPRRFRMDFGDEMKLVFKDLLDDPTTSRRRMWSIVFVDLAAATRGPRLGAL